MAARSFVAIRRMPPALKQNRSFCFSRGEACASSLPDGLNLVRPLRVIANISIPPSQRRFIEAEWRAPPKARHFCLTLGYSGSRISDVLALTPVAIDIESGAISIQTLIRPCRQTNGRSKRTCEPTSSIVPRGTSFHRVVDMSFLLLDLILHGTHATAASRVHRNSVPSIQMRCMITAKRHAGPRSPFSCRGAWRSASPKP